MILRRVARWDTLYGVGKPNHASLGRVNPRVTAPIAQDSLLAVDVGNRALNDCGIQESLV